MTAVEDLERRFGRAGAVVFGTSGAAVVAKVLGRGGEATVALQGAQVLSWVNAECGEMLWWSTLSPAGTGAPIRGGIPICWPWFGPHATDATKPAHGLARTAMFEVVSTGANDGCGFVVLSTKIGEALLKVRVECGAHLDVRFETLNEGRAPLAVTEALHTYFAVEDVTRVSVHGLDGCRYRDRTQGDIWKEQHGPVIAVEETNAHFDDTPDVLRLSDPLRGHDIKITRIGGRSTVVWNPGRSATKMADVPTGEERRFLCVESGNVGAAETVVDPGRVHRLGVHYAVERRGG